MWAKPSIVLKAILSLSVCAQVTEGVVTETSSELQVLETEIAAMDFMDTTVSVMEMKEKLVRRMPVPANTVMSDAVRDFQATDEQVYRTFKSGKYE